MAERVLPEDALTLMEDEGYAYVDVRSINEFEGGHPEGAYNVPLKHMAPGGMQDNGDFLAVMEESFPKDAKIIVACKAGGRSKAAVEMLEAAGYTALVDQYAGFMGSRDAFGQMEEAGWQPSGLPVSLDAEEGRSYAELAKRAGKNAPEF